MRDYGLTGDKAYHDEGMAAIGRVKETVGQAGQLADETIHLTKLKGSLGDNGNWARIYWTIRARLSNFELMKSPDC